jgi:tryptophan synthase alpha subunit
MAHGEQASITDAKQAGANGFIVVDLPPEEAVKFRTLCTGAGFVFCSYIYFENYRHQKRTHSLVFLSPILVLMPTIFLITA